MLGVVLALAVVIWIPFDVFRGGNIHFYGKWIACGQKPIVTDPHGFVTGGVPYYEVAPTFQLERHSTLLFCTPLQAEEAGFSADPHKAVFPAIDHYNATHPNDQVRAGSVSG